VLLNEGVETLLHSVLDIYGFTCLTVFASYFNERSMRPANVGLSDTVMILQDRSLIMLYPTHSI